jgi:autotransporter-associated beta strand protein
MRFLHSSYHHIRLFALATGIVFIWQSSGAAQSGTWTSIATGNYSTPSNWQSNVVANGATNTANFNADIVGEVDVILDSNRTLGHLSFTDTSIASPGIWVVLDGGPGNRITLDNGASKPTITVNPMGTVNIPDIGDFNETFIDASLAGTNGFAKLGAGVLTLDGDRNTISGVVNVNEGTLRLGSQPGGPPGFQYSNDGITPISQTITQFVIANGATLENSQLAQGGDFANVVNNVTVAAGATATFRQNGNGNGSVNNITGSGTGEVLNLNIAFTQGTGTTLSVGGNATGFTTVNVNGQGGTPAFLRLLSNPTGGPVAFNANSFATSTLNLNNAQLLVRTNSGGNDYNIGALNGNATAQLGGGNSGTAVRYHIGALNTNMTFAGSLVMGGTVAAPVGMLVDKVGTGTLTLSGTNTYTTTNNANANLRGGVTRITAGTLALSGPATIPGGITDGTLGDLYTTIDIRAGATFNVTATNTTYSTAPLQHVIGTGTIVGNYLHDEGRLRPGDIPQTANPNGNITTATAGTLTFNNNLSFAGAGEIIYDMTTNPATGNDLIQVNGATTLTSSSTKVTPNFLGNIPTSGTYTILNSAGGFVGTPAGWTVDWPGRGPSPAVVLSGNQLQFTAIPFSGDGVSWRGTAGSNWDVETTQNWHNNDENVQDEYFNGDSVVLADTFGPGNTPVGTFTVNLVSNVSPASVTVNSTNNYTFGGTGVITGGASFTKRGSSTLTMQKANTFTGPATIEAGNVDIGTFTGALGTGNLTMSGGRLTVANTVGGALTNSLLTMTAATTSTIYANGAPTGGANTNPLALPNLAGDGELRLTTAVNGRLVDIGSDNTAFTGDLTIGPDTTAGATTMAARLNDAASSLANSHVTLEAGTTLSSRAQPAATIQIGALTGAAGTDLDGFAGGGTSPQAKTWEIGALGVSTTFAGVITDGGNANGTSATHLTKVGAGTLTLTGANSYTGDTTVEGGTLSVSTPYLSDLADVFLSAGSILNLSFPSNTPDVIDSLFINGVSMQAGTWGAPGNMSATFHSALISGTGILDVTTFIPPAGLTGDYNDDGMVDAADYVVWRKFIGAEALENRDPDNAGPVGEPDYASWRENFGTIDGGGGFAVPEPASLVLIFLSLALHSGSRRRK